MSPLPLGWCSRLVSLSLQYHRLGHSKFPMIPYSSPQYFFSFNSILHLFTFPFSFCSRQVLSYGVRFMSDHILAISYILLLDLSFTQPCSTLLFVDTPCYHTASLSLFLCHFSRHYDSLSTSFTWVPDRLFSFVIRVCPLLVTCSPILNHCMQNATVLAPNPAT